jgi:ubiquinone/menaquinone biosynthesis C-methylase UbiE
MNGPQRTESQERWLRFFNTIGYNALVPVYNAMDWLTFGAWWRLVSRALDYVPPGGRVLEVGFGPGKLHTALARQAELCVGVDYARGMCRFTDRRLRQAGLSPHIVRGSVFALPCPDSAFDTVVSTFAFSGFRDGPDAMREMARAAAPGGRVVLVDIGLPSDGNRAGVFWARLWERMGDFLYDMPTLMEDNGLVVTICREFGPGRHIRAVVGEKVSGGQS